MNEAWAAFLAACGGVVTVSAAIGAIKKWVSPAFNINDRFKKIEERQAKDYQRINKNEETSKLLCRGMLCLLDVFEENEKDNPHNAQRIAQTKKDIQDFLING